MATKQYQEYGEELYNATNAVQAYIPVESRNSTDLASDATPYFYIFEANPTDE